MANIVSPEKPLFPGYGTPFLSIYDRDKKLILDKITLDDGTDRPLALSDFSYTFNETEDDMGSITLHSDSPAFMDNFRFRHKGVLYIQWGWLNGDKRPLLRVLIRNFKETYNSSGYSLNLSISDNYAPAKNSKSPTRAKLEQTLSALTGILKDPSKEIEIERFLNPLTGANMDSISLPLNTDILEIDKPDSTAWKIDFSIPPPKEKTGLLDDATLRFFESLGYAPGTVPEGYDVENKQWKEGEEPKSKDQGTVYTGTNMNNLTQDFIDKTSEEPTVVSGSDGEVKIFKRRRVSLFPPITEYTFRGGDGRLLEFNYDSDATYDDDDSVLRTLSVNPETGAVQVTDYANSVRRIADAYDPFQYEGLKFDAKAYEAAMELALNGRPINELGIDRQAPVTDAISKPMLIQWGTTENASGGINVARDNTAVVTQFRSVPLSQTAEAIDIIENELKNLKAEDAFRTRATAKTLGDPSISNGVNILIKGLSKARQGTYHITSCTHTIGSSGYTNSYEMYKVSDIPSSVDVIKSGKTSTEINKEISDKDNTLKSQARYQSLMESQGYIPIYEIVNTDYYEEMNKLDKDWVTKVGYTDYEIIYDIPNFKGTGEKLVGARMVIRVPNNPTSLTHGKTLDSILGFDDLYRVIGARALNATVIKTKTIKGNNVL
jgi:hypothetical protein